MADTLKARARYRFIARLAEQANRFDEMVDAMKKVGMMKCELTAEEINLLSSGYKKAAGLRQASCRVLSSLEKDEELGGNEFKLQIVKEYRAKIESEVSDICSEIISIIDRYLIPFSSAGPPAAFYHKMKGDFCWFLANIRADNERKEAIDNSFRAYKLASTIADEVLYDHHPVRLGLAMNLTALEGESPHTVKGAKFIKAMSELPWEYRSLPHVPDELVLSVLVNLKTKTLFSFAAVSKLWNNLIFSEELSKMRFLAAGGVGGGVQGILHYSQNERTLRWIEVNIRSEIHKEPTMTISLLGPNMMENIWDVSPELLQCCRGILLFNRGGEGFLVNPVTNEFLRLPNHETFGGSGWHGFGYDSRNDRFKVLTIQGCKAYVYRLGVRAWIEVSFPDYVRLEAYLPDRFNIENFFHFSATILKPDDFGRVAMFVFNWESEKFSELPWGPGKTMRNLKEVLIGSSKGKLVELYHGYDLTHFSVWRQEVYGQAESWVELLYVQCNVHPLDWFSMVTLLDDNVVVLESNVNTLVLLDEGGLSNLGRYRCTGMWNAVESQSSSYKLEFQEPGFVEEIVACNDFAGNMASKQ